MHRSSCAGPGGSGSSNTNIGGSVNDFEHHRHHHHHHHHVATAMTNSAAFHWGAVLAGGMMQPPSGAEYAPAPAHHPASGAGHTSMPIDLHVSQAFPYYRYRDDALCWTDRKPSMDDVGNPNSVNARSTISPYI
ncbi:POU domain, class 4, transcription factor 2-like [Trichogramma pretiosum]|uniref:POU domain, class 4, transcription factor 2-like n=1 Tax=Trichogramma pretiosum TaxID=7493 RepID=UPI000C71BF21|nr:POU domain, class 4, transcription factor 2-like [Trichogramma pretiosum]